MRIALILIAVSSLMPLVLCGCCALERGSRQSNQPGGATSVDFEGVALFFQGVALLLPKDHSGAWDIVHWPEANVDDLARLAVKPGASHGPVYAHIRGRGLLSGPGAYGLTGCGTNAVHIRDLSVVRRATHSEASLWDREVTERANWWFEE